tara:strand:+ start:175 stop:612 length:438 start_codon:yes stop_codon:yes gene_type:complete
VKSERQIQQMFKQMAGNPPASPFFYKSQRFSVTTLQVGTAPIALSPEQLYCESIFLVAPIGNSANVTLWRSDNIANGTGLTLSPGDSSQMSVDNMTWQVARSISGWLSFENPFPRQSIDANQWACIGAAINQTILVQFNFGDETL